ncbi:hypothetical protein J6590_050650 [Homalodisca vitripennis]|nr:hypothetical protein J6590_050650 [Homalodisca vitripennis]
MAARGLVVLGCLAFILLFPTNAEGSELELVPALTTWFLSGSVTSDLMYDHYREPVCTQRARLYTGASLTRWIVLYFAPDLIDFL